MSLMCVSRPTSGVRRCERSPSPVKVGVYTRCPAVASRGVSFFQHQPPCQPPCTSTKVRRFDRADAVDAVTAAPNGNNGIPGPNCGAVPRAM